MFDNEQRRSELVIGSEIACPTCAIVFEGVATLAGAQISSATRIARGPDGRYYLLDDSDRLVKLYGSDGRFIRQIGRLGGGPGEYEFVRNLLVDADGSLRILDLLLSRFSTFSHDGAFVKGRPISLSGGPGMSAILLPNQQLVVNAPTRNRAGANYALRLIDLDGKAERHLDEISVNESRNPALIERRLWLRAGGELLVARPYTFTIDVYAPDFNSKRPIIRVADWIPSETPEWEEPTDGLYDKPMTPRLITIWEDEEGLLWLIMHVPASDWRPSKDPLTKETWSKVVDRPRVETIVEVVDLKRRVVLTRYRTLGSIGIGFGGGYFAKLVGDTGIESGLQISRVHLKR